VSSPQLKERFLRDPQPVRLGNLASSLARVASCAPRPTQASTVASLLDECKRFLEWAGPDAAPEVQPDMVRLQVDIARWRRRWNPAAHDPAQASELAVVMRAGSQKALEWSGLLRD
jgi:hypothetical protein